MKITEELSKRISELIDNCGRDPASDPPKLRHLIIEQKVLPLYWSMGDLYALNATGEVLSFRWVEPTLTQTFSLYGITAFEVQYWNGSSWVAIPNGNVTGNNKVWRQFSFSSITTSKIRVVVNAGADNAFSRVVEVEAYAAPPATNVALPANGGAATASSYYSDPTWGTYLPAYANDGSRRALNHAHWMDNTLSSFNGDWVEIDFSGDKAISEIDVVTQQDDYQNPVEPTLTQTFSLYGITAFEVQYWNGSSWVAIPNGNVTGNNKVWRQFSFSSITTSKIRVVVNAGADNAFSRVVEVEAWTAAISPPNLNWLVTDQLGTPRMVFDKSSALANVKRHDYLPFGEELGAGLGGRTPTQGYNAVDGVRQKFTQKERDIETGLDYFGARYYSSVLGRFTSSDPLGGRKVNPQTLNRYSYVKNNPLKYIDLFGYNPQDSKQKDCQDNKCVNDYDNPEIVKINSKKLPWYKRAWAQGWEIDRRSISKVWRK